MSIILHLDSQLKLYKYNLVKHDLQLVDLLIGQGKYLNLSDQFEFFWQTSWPFLENESEFFLILGPNSGFTDTRVVFTWLKSFVMFYPGKQIYSTNLASDLDLDNLASALIEDILNTARQSDFVIKYSKEPSIGK